MHKKLLKKFNIHLWLKTPQIVGIKGTTSINLIKAICDKPTANILNGKETKPFPLRSEIR